MTGILVLTAMIPRDVIRANALESAEYLYDGELFGCVAEGVEGSRIDRYADAILLNIAYHYDAVHPLRSVMLSAYYFTPYHEENENLLIAVRDDMEANQQYLRYWHGSNIIVRPLLTVIAVKQIYILNGAVLAILLAVFVLLAVRWRQTLLAVGMTASMAVSAAWFVPLSLEYTWTFIIMLASAVIVLCLSHNGKTRGYGTFFLTVGMLTAFFDFLTTETLTLLIPLLVLLWMGRGGRAGHTMSSEGYGERSGISRIAHYPWDVAIGSAVAWGAGYVGMWLLKWVLAAVTYRENVMPYITEHIGERLGGDLGLNLWQYLTGAVMKNAGCLFPLGYGGAGAVAGILLIIYAAYRGYVYHVKGYDKESILLYALIGLVPYIRYLVLHNHSYIHCFFTYRTQAATVLAIVMIAGELTDRNRSGHVRTA